MREFRKLFAGLFAALLLIEAILLAIVLRERDLREATLTDQWLLLQAREAINTELDDFVEISDRAIKAATTGDGKLAKAHEDLRSSILNRSAAANSSRIMAADLPFRLQRLQEGDAVYRNEDFSALQKALDDARSLLQADRKALHALRGLFPDAEGNFTIRGKNDPSLSLAMLTDEISALKRSSVRDTLSDFLAATDVRIYATVEKNAVAIQRYSLLLSLMIALLLLATIAAGIFLYRNITEPLQSFRVHSRKINDDLARTLSQLETVTAERDALRKHSEAPQNQPPPAESLHQMP